MDVQVAIKMSFNPLQENWNALMEAAQYGNLDIAKMLLARGADPNMQDDVSHIAFPVHYV